jgi:hypothetical protein
LRTKLLATIAALLLGVGLAACGDDSDDSPAAAAKAGDDPVSVSFTVALTNDPFFITQALRRRGRGQEAQRQAVLPGADVGGLPAGAQGVQLRAREAA